MDGKHIAVLELISIIIVTIIWGPSLTGRRVLANCDNSAVVSVLNTGYSRDKSLMQLLCCLFLLKLTSNSICLLPIFQGSLTHVQMIYPVISYHPSNGVKERRLPSQTTPTYTIDSQ